MKDLQIPEGRKTANPSFSSLHQNTELNACTSLGFSLAGHIDLSWFASSGWLVTLASCIAFTYFGNLELFPKPRNEKICETDGVYFLDISILLKLIHFCDTPFVILSNIECPHIP